MSGEAFDLDKWLSGTTRIVKYVDIYGKPGLQAEIDELDSLLRRTEDTTERHAIAERIEALRTEMEASRVGFKFTSLADERVTALRDEHKDDEDYALAVAAEQCVTPAGFTLERMRALFAAIGEGYFAQTVLATANAAQQGMGVTVPFSSAASAALRR